MLSIVNGVIKNHPLKIEAKIISNIEHGPISKIRSLVIHRTTASTAKSTLTTWKTKKTGAHFLIDKNGKVYQTARLSKRCWHMGLVLSRCKFEKSCTIKDAKIIHNILYSKKSWPDKFKNVLQHERKKSYPDRYPMNSDSIGIEVVGLYLGGKSEKGVFEKITRAQAVSLLWVITELLQRYKLSFADDIYAHGEVAHKRINEGSDALDWLWDNYI